MAPLVIPPIKTAIAHPRKQPIVLPPQLDPTCVLCLLPLRDDKWYDYSGKGNHGTISGSTWVSKGRLGAGMYFDGLDDDVNCGNAESLDITAAITVEVWAKALTTWVSRGICAKKDIGFPPNSVQYSLQGSWANNGYGKAKGGYTGRVLLQIWDDYSNAYWTIGDNIATPINQWVHFVCTFKENADGTDAHAKFFRGEHLKNTLVVPNGVIKSNLADLRISEDGYSHFLNGIIDEVRIYNRALELDEIKALYELGREVRS